MKKEKRMGGGIVGERQEKAEGRCNAKQVNSRMGWN